MGHFSEYMMQQQTDRIAAVLVAAEIDVDKFCEDVMNIFDGKTVITESELLVELGNRNSLGGLSNAAVAVGGLRGLGGMAKPGFSAAGEVGRSLGELGKTLGAGIKSAWNATGGKALSVVGDHMAQGAQAEKLRQAQNAVFALQKQLQGYGYNDDVLNKTFKPLLQAITQDFEGNKQLGHRLGTQTPQAPTTRPIRQARTTATKPNMAVSPELSSALDKALASPTSNKTRVNPLATQQYMA